MTDWLGFHIQPGPVEVGLSGNVTLTLLVFDRPLLFGAVDPFQIRAACVFGAGEARQPACEGEQQTD